MARILMVSGDVGGAQIQLPVYKKLQERSDLNIQIVADADPVAKAYTVWERAGINFSRMFPSAELEDAARDADVIFTGSCATAFAAEVFAIRAGDEAQKVTVIGSDFWFNHGYKFWRNSKPDFWLAIDVAHQTDILSRREKWTQGQVPILGQPNFDHLVGLMENRETIRSQRRSGLSIENDEVVLLFWGSARKDFCEADFEILTDQISILAHLCENLVLIPRLHPKMSAVIGEEYFVEYNEKIKNLCVGRARLIWGNDIAPDELNLAADIVVTSWSTQGITSAIIGTPTINTFSRVHELFLQNDLDQTRPYLPTIKCGAASAVFREESDYIIKKRNALYNILNPRYREMLRKNAEQMKPSGDSAEKIAKFLLNLL